MMAPVRISLLLPALLALVCFAACEDVPPIVTSHHRPETYYLVEVTNPRGELVADWVAEGHVWQTAAHYYRFRAVERNTGGPYPQQIRYPDGRFEETSGANIHVIPCGKPLWLYESDGK
jgi:hypothetical protein